jgi:hypothetical protein
VGKISQVAGASELRYTSQLQGVDIMIDQAAVLRKMAKIFEEKKLVCTKFFDINDDNKNKAISHLSKGFVGVDKQVLLLSEYGNIISNETTDLGELSFDDPISTDENGVQKISICDVSRYIINEIEPLRVIGDVIITENIAEDVQVYKTCNEVLLIAEMRQKSLLSIYSFVRNAPQDLENKMKLVFIDAETAREALDFGEKFREIVYSSTKRMINSIGYILPDGDCASIVGRGVHK